MTALLLLRAVISWALLGAISLAAFGVLVEPVVGTAERRLSELAGTHERLLTVRQRSLDGERVAAASADAAGRLDAAGILRGDVERAGRRGIELIAAALRSAGAPGVRVTAVRAERSGATSLHRIRIEGDVDAMGTEKVVRSLEAVRPRLAFDTLAIEAQRPSPARVRLVITARFFAIDLPEERP